MTESKFCPSCGTKQEADAKFCPQCGYNFENKAMPTVNNGTSEKSTSSKIDIKSLFKNKVFLISIGVVLTLLIASVAFGGIDIAGSYESEDTIEDAEYSTTIEITRNGKLTLIDADFAEGMNAELSFHIVEDETQNGYVMDVSKGLELEFRVPNDTLSDSSYASNVDYLAEEYGLEQEEKDGEIVLSGEMTALEASALDIDFSESYITLFEGTDQIIFDDTLFIKQ